MSNLKYARAVLLKYPGFVCLWLLLSTCFVLAGVAQSKELTAEQRAFIFGKPKSVIVKQRIGLVRMEGTDYRGYYKCPYLRAYVNGKGPFTVLFDTGAAYNILSSKLIKAAGLDVMVDRGGHHDLLRVQKVNIGDVEITDLPAVRDDDYGVDGVIGFRSFGDMNLLFELSRRRLMVSAEPIPLLGSFTVPYKLTLNLPTIPVMVGNAETATLIDTGDDAFSWEVRTEDLKAARLAHEPVPAGSALNGARVQQTSVSTLAEESHVQLGPISVRNAVVGINDSLPIPDFGVDYLEQFNFEFVPDKMIIMFQPLSAGSGTKIVGNRSAGFTPEFAGKDTVHSVVADSPADKAGMRPGDSIVSINGRDVKRYEPRSWDEMLSSRKALTVIWRKGDKMRTDKFPVTTLQ